MYSTYNAETLEKLIDTVHQICNTTSFHERLFAGQQISLPLRSFTRITALFNQLITLLKSRTGQIHLILSGMTQLHIYARAIRVLTKGYLSISLITPLKLKEILNEVKVVIRKTNPDYDLVVDILHLYYDMKLVTFGIDKERNLIYNFHYLYNYICNKL